MVLLHYLDLLVVYNTQVLGEISEAGVVFHFLIEVM
jgi:hypothetical protein